MEAHEARQHLIGTGALREGHFLLPSGKHGRWSLNPVRALVWPSKTALFGNHLGRAFEHSAVDFVLGSGQALVLAQEVARFLGVPCVGGATGPENSLKPELDLQQGCNVLLVMGLIDSAEPLDNWLTALRRESLNIAGVACLAAAGAILEEPPVEIPLHAVWDEYDAGDTPRECSECRAGKPVDTAPAQVLARRLPQSSELAAHKQA